MAETLIYAWELPAGYALRIRPRPVGRVAKVADFRYNLHGPKVEAQDTSQIESADYTTTSARSTERVMASVGAMKCAAPS